MALNLARIIGTITGKVAFERTDANFQAIQTDVNANTVAIAGKLGTAHNTDGTAHNDIREQINSLASQIGIIESQTILENYLSAHNIPSTANRGKLDVLLKGMSAVNLVKNGNFANGTTGWNVGSGTTVRVVNNKLILTGNGTSNSPFVSYGTGSLYTVGHKYYIKVNVKSLKAGATSLRHRVFNADVVDFQINDPVLNQEYTLTRVFTQMSASSGAQVLACIHPNNVTGDVMEISYFSAIDLTALFGAGNEPTVEQCDKMFAKWFDGLQGANNIIVKSTGKNLFDGNLESGVYSTGNGSKSANSAYIRSTNKVKIDKTKTYRVSRDFTGEWFFLYYDANNTYLSSQGTTSTSITLVIPHNAVYVSFYMLTTDTMKRIQFEEGTFTPYEPYKVTEATYKTLDGQPITLHRLPNGVCDKITEDGKLIKRVGEYLLKASDITGMFTLDTTVDYAKLAYTQLNGNAFTLVQGENTKYLHSTFPTEAWVSGSNTANTVFDFNTFIGFKFAKGTTLVQAQTALAGTKLIYELAQPQIIDTNAVPLLAEPSGTVFISSDGCIPSNELSYPLNLGAVVDGLVDGLKEQGSLLKNKVNNVQFDWITGTLQNGWTGTFRYRKNQIGQTEVEIYAVSGTITANTVIANIPEKYRPTRAVVIPVLQATDLKASQFLIFSPTTGNIVIPGTSGIESTKTYSTVIALL